MAKKRIYIGMNPATGGEIKLTKRPIPPEKLTLSQLKLEEEILLQFVPADQDRIKALYKAEIANWNKVKEQRKLIEQNIDNIKKEAHLRRQRSRHEYEKLSLLKKCFSGFEEVHQTQEEFNMMKTELDKLSKLPQYFQSQYTKDIKKITQLSRIRKAIAGKEQEKREEEKKKTARAIIAMHYGKSRDLAESVKKELKEQISISPQCPYCGGDLGKDPHCDHIYPVSKGGLSTQNNMVYICSGCNLKKRTFTLSQFIEKYSLQRVEIVKRLSKLGKDH